MAGDHKSKKLLENAKVYIHNKDKETGSNNIHIDIEHEELNEIIEPGENTFVGGKKGGIFVGLKDQMIDRAEKWLEKRQWKNKNNKNLCKVI